MRRARPGVVLSGVRVPAALALVFRLADGHRGPVGFASTLRALHWSAYLETHARRCYGIAQGGEVETARRILERITKGDLPRGGFGTRDVWRPGWAGLADQKRVAAGLDLLVELGHLEAWQEPTRGRVKTLYVVNPKSLRLRPAWAAIGSARRVRLQPVLQGSIDAGLPAVAAGPEGFHHVPR